jgi:hypothetical protein
MTRIERARTAGSGGSVRVGTDGLAGIENVTATLIPATTPSCATAFVTS